MSVTSKQTSSKQWNISMLNAKKHMQDKDTRGDVSSKKDIIKLQKIYEKIGLSRIEESSGYRAYESTSH